MDEAPTLALLAAKPFWVAWQIEARADGKPTKVPYAPDGRRARANSPATWGVRPDAERRATLLSRPYGVGGVGLEFAPLGNGRSLAGIDLDTCREPDSGKMEGWAEDVLAQFDSYAEVSPSRTGAKLFFTYDTDALASVFRPAMGKPLWGKQFKRGGGEHPPAIELHLGNRFFAVTDEALNGSSPEIRYVEASTVLRLINTVGPAFQGERSGGARSSTPGSDQSRSAIAMRKGGALVRAGKTYAEMVAALRADPETAEWCREKGTSGGERELRRIFEKAEAGLKVDGFELNEDGIAQAFTKRHADRLRYCHHTGAWFEWTGERWRVDETKRGFSWARLMCRELGASAVPGVRAKIARAATAAAVERYAQADATHSVTSEVWDRDPLLLGTPSGTVDLRTGQIRQARPGDYITKQTAVAPADTPHIPLWDAFLADATGDDPALVRFLRQWFGYCLTGDTREQALFFGHGPGGNGKGVLLNTVAGIMGDYARQAAMDTFTATTGDRHPTDLAMLRGARMVCASETEEGRSWAEARIKSLTGGDAISARFMRQDFFEYRPQFKLVIVGNHKPILRNVDEAMRRRFNIVPFPHKPPVPDLQLEAKLRAEWPGILRWMMEGCLDWLRHGLVRPKVVTDATAEYFATQDYFGRWLADHAKLDPNLSSRPGELLADFREWCTANGEPPPGSIRSMIERTPGLKYVTVNGSQLVKGIGLNPPAKARRGDRVEAGGG